MAGTSHSEAGLYARTNRWRLSYATVVATVALVFGTAFGGTVSLAEATSTTHQGRPFGIDSAIRARPDGEGTHKNRTDGHRAKSHKRRRKGHTRKSKRSGSQAESGSSPTSPPTVSPTPESTPTPTPTPPGGVTTGLPVTAPTPPPVVTPPLTPCTNTSSSIAALQTAVSNAPAGAVVCLTDGTYGKLTLNAKKSGAGVTVRAANPAGATINGASLAGSGLRLAEFVSTGEIEVLPGASKMTIEHNRITGGGEGIDAGPTTTTSINDLQIIGNQLIGPFGEDAIHLNRYHDGDGDGIGILIEGNEITGVRENGSHSDCLQTVWTGDHLIFRRNYLHNNRCQGFFIKDQASLPASTGVVGPIEGITVEDNLFLRNTEPCAASAPGCGQPNYFQVFGPYSGFRMTHNTIWGDGESSIATFREGTGSNTVIGQNVIYRLWTDTDMSGATLAENTVCQRETGSGGAWPGSRPGETNSCSPAFTDTAVDDYRLAAANGRGIDWAPAAQHYGP